MCSVCMYDHPFQTQRVNAQDFVSNRQCAAV